MSKTAVVLFNLGGPDSKEAIEPFLFNFFTDPNIISLPYPFRWLLAKLISKRRSKAEAGESYGELGNKSPLLENTRAQAKSLEDVLNAKGDDEFKVFTSMRYWHPMAPEVIDEINSYEPDRLFLLPLYPQFSTTTVKSSLEDFWASVQQDDGWLHMEWEQDVKVASICCYPFNEGFIQASADNVGAMLEQAKKDGHEAPRILFSAHGLPEKIIKAGDPYQWQCEQVAEKIVAALGIDDLDWAVCYQSKVGRLTWIGPSLDEELKRAAQDKRAVVIYTHAFTQEHVETLVELDIEYKHIANDLGIAGYYRAETVGTHPAFIDGLADIVQKHVDQECLSAEGCQQLCPNTTFKNCPMETNYG